MKELFYAIFMFAVLTGIATAQRLVPVPPDVIDGLATTIKNDSVARKAALPTQTIYMLKRNGTYPMVSAIDNTNYFLYIKAESGPGYKPLLVPSPTSGTTYAYNMNFRSSGKLEGLTLEALRPTGGVNNRYINLYNGATLWVKDCEVVHDRGSAFALWSDHCSIFIEDCFIHSIGHPKTVGGNGRVVDLRPTCYIADSVVVKNTTFFNLTDRIVRNMNTVVGYLKFDHNTGLTTEGYHGGFQAGKVRELIVTNNIFYNTITFGSHKKRVYPAVISEQTQPEKNLMYVLTMDTSYLVPNPKVTVRNNNIWWDQRYKDIWLKYKDSTVAPGIITPTIMKSLGADSSKAYFVDPLTFQAPPAQIYNFIDSALQFPNSTSLPENWSFAFQEADGLSPINCSYGTTALSYTKGDGGFPIGDLNWYPSKKASWILTGVEDVEKVIPFTFSLSQNYPNPFNPSTNITFGMSTKGFVSLKVYDILGREVGALINEVKEAGIHTFSWDATGKSSGIYFYKMQAGSFVSMKKMILIR